MSWKERLYILGIVIGVYAGIRFLLPITIPFLFGWLLAVWVYPFAVKIENITPFKRGNIGVICLAAVMTIAAVCLYMGLTVLFRQIRLAVSSYHGLEVWGMQILKQGCHILERWTGISQEESRQYILRRMEAMQNTLLMDLSPTSMVKMLSSIKWIIKGVSIIVIIFISGMLFLKDMEEIEMQFHVRREFRMVRHILYRLKNTVALYLNAQIKIMVVIGTICSVGFWLLKSPYYLLYGVALGALDALPLIGTGTILYPAAFIYFLNGNTLAAVGCVMLDLVTSLVRQYLEPKLLGKTLGVYPIVILVSIYAGFFLYGWSGFILGPFSFILIYEIGKEMDLWAWEV